MKRLLFILCILQVSFLQAQWRTIFQDADSINSISGASFYSLKEGWVTTHQWVGFTEDGGQSFEHRLVSPENIEATIDRDRLHAGFLPLSVSAFGHDTVFVTGSFGNDPAILFSKDNGYNWSLVYHHADTSDLPSGNAIYKIVFPQNGNIGYAVQSNEIIKTTDKGKTWRTCFQGTDKGLFTLGFVDDRNGYAAGPNTLLQTADGGNTWSTIGGLSSTIQAISVIDKQKLAILGSREENYFTKLSLNGGKSWAEEIAFPKMSEQLVLNDIRFTDELNGYAYGSAVYTTRNGGKEWKVMPGSDSNVVAGGYLSMFLLNNKHSWLTGPSGLLKRNQLPGFLKLHSALNAVFCKDSAYTLRWTAVDTDPLDIYYSVDNGNHFEKVASSLQPGDSSFSFKLSRKEVEGGTIIFKITDENSSIVDTTAIQLASFTAPSVSLKANETNKLNSGEYEFRASSSQTGDSTQYKWYLNGTMLPDTDSVVTLAKLHDNDQVQVKFTTFNSCIDKFSGSSNVVTIGNGIDDSRLQIALSPNPTASIVDITSLKSADQWLTADVIDSRGQQKVATQAIANKSSVRIQVESLPKGVYFVRLISQTKQTKALRFVKL